jgi:hypothetical protein
MTKDINLDSSTKSAPVGGESPKAIKPPTLSTKETAPELLKPPSPSGAHSFPSAGGAPSSSTRAASSPDPAGASSSPMPAESPKTFLESPRSYGLEAAGGTELVRAHLCPDWKSHCDSICGSQSRCLITPSLSKLGSTSASSSR